MILQRFFSLKKNNNESVIRGATVATPMQADIKINKIQADAKIGAMRHRSQIEEWAEREEQRKKEEAEEKHRAKEKSSNALPWLASLGVGSSLLLMLVGAAATTVASVAAIEVAATLGKKIPLFFMRRPKPPTFAQRVSHRLFGDTRFYNSQKPELLASPFRKMCRKALVGSTLFLAIDHLDPNLIPRPSQIKLRLLNQIDANEQTPNPKQPIAKSKLTKKQTKSLLTSLIQKTNQELCKPQIKNASQMFFSASKDFFSSIDPSGCLQDTSLQTTKPRA